MFFAIILEYTVKLSHSGDGYSNSCEPVRVMGCWSYYKEGTGSDFGEVKSNERVCLKVSWACD